MYLLAVGEQAYRKDPNGSFQFSLSGEPIGSFKLGTQVLDNPKFAPGWAKVVIPVGMDQAEHTAGEYSHLDAPQNCQSPINAPRRLVPAIS